jgi:hypothetical protein
MLILIQTKIIKFKMTILLHSFCDYVILIVKQCLKIYTVRNMIMK